MTTSSSQTAAYLALSGLTIMLYDTLLTLNKEISLIWQRRIRLGTILYMSARYGTILQLGAQIASYIRLQPLEFCTTINFFAKTFNFIGGIGAGGLGLARAYALSGGNGCIKTILLTLFLAGQGVQIAQFPFMPCNTRSRALYTTSVASDVLDISTEALVVVIAVRHTWNLYKSFQILYSPQANSLEFLVFQQGVLRFIFVLCADVLLIGVDKSINPLLVGAFSGIANGISVILLGRFLLQLREFGRMEARSQTSFCCGMTLSGFRAAIRGFDDDISNEFGDFEPEKSTKSVGIQPQTVHPDTESAPRITVEEFPWVGNGRFESSSSSV